MPDAAAEPGTAAARSAAEAAEEKSAFSHPAVDPDSTAVYGDHPDQVIDFYVPRGAVGPGGAAPVVVVLHGGSWRAPYDRRHVSPFAGFLARRGLAVASVEYRRGADGGDGAEGAGGAGGAGGGDAGGPVAGRWPETFDDVAAALDALPALVRQHLPQADARRVVLTGHPPAATPPCGRPPGICCPTTPLGASTARRLCAVWSPSRRSPTSRSPTSSTCAAVRRGNSSAGRSSSPNAGPTRTRPCCCPPASPRPSFRGVPTWTFRRRSPRRMPRRGGEGRGGGGRDAAGGRRPLSADRPGGGRVRGGGGGDRAACLVRPERFAGRAGVRACGRAGPGRTRST